jgi:hypothetical protein
LAVAAGPANSPTATAKTANAAKMADRAALTPQLCGDVLMRFPVLESAVPSLRSRGGSYLLQAKIARLDSGDIE